MKRLQISCCRVRWCVYFMPHQFSFDCEPFPDNLNIITPVGQHSFMKSNSVSFVIYREISRHSVTRCCWWHRCRCKVSKLPNDRKLAHFAGDDFRPTTKATLIQSGTKVTLNLMFSMLPAVSWDSVTLYVQSLRLSQQWRFILWSAVLWHPVFC